MAQNKLHIGDRVRFLNSTGGGVIREISKDGVVGVEDESGFILPVLATEVVVVTPHSTIVPKVERPTVSPKSQPLPTLAHSDTKAKKRESRPTSTAGDLVNVYLAYLPEDPAEIGTGNYEAYLVNDSNYDLQLLYMTGATGEKQVRYAGVVPFDSVILLESFSPSSVPERTRIQIQMIPYKSDTPFRPKSPYDIEKKIEGSRFFKAHAFVSNDFFDDGAILLDLVSNDRPVNAKELDAEAIRHKILSTEGKGGADHNRKKETSTPSRESKRVVDLHIAELLDTTAGMSNGEILEYQLDTVRKVMKEEREHSGMRVIFVHGKGEGVLRRALLDLIKREYPKCEVQDASFQEYGFGATQVTIRK